ncbi:YkgJ family cysteine cluster protein [Acidovorax delafieldii]|mgnify:CR=1 FL=1|jgi:Fe-S-cluster containining protein|uniref:YkgJ family cysteine cluster protein n=1 Tax=Acidovorax delafieldii TaxID=47920 RepID=UPI003ECD4967
MASEDAPTLGLRRDDRAAHMQRVREREEEILSAEYRASVDERALAVLLPANPDRTRLVNMALQAPTRTKSITWLRKAADRLSQAVGNEVACRRGCDACCYLDVAVSKAEAESIGRAIGRKPVESPATAIAVSSDLNEPHEYPNRHLGKPCTFLRDSECSIHADRPLVCRLHANFDRDNLLCQIVPGETISVPYVDTSIEKAVYHAKVAAGGMVADIRDWFPALPPQG